MMHTASQNNEERRFLHAELRAAGRRLEGYAAVFGAVASIAGFTETIMPGAFAESLRSGGDILALVDHDPNRVLARTKSGTLRLREDEKGLRFELDLPDTQAAHDTLALATRGDLGGASFGFFVPAGGDRWDGKRRSLTKVDLREISVVSAWPAYQGTSVSARALQFAQTAATPRLARARKFLETV